MNTYRIRYILKVAKGVETVKADTVNGFKPTCDSYVFKRGQEVVAVIPKANVASVEKIDQEDVLD